MITISAALKAHLAQPYQTTCTLWKVTLVNGTILGFTDLDVDIVFGGVTFMAQTGYTRTDIAGSDDLSVDNMEVDGMISSPSITEDALREGVWDYAAIKVSLINWADLTMGEMILRTGTLGEITLERDTFKAELRGLCQAYSRTIGELTSPGCRAELFDARCKVNPATFTKTGTLTGVNPNKLVYYDTARTEPGPAGGVAITAITNSNPGHVTVASATGLSNGMAVTLSGIVGPDLLNADTIIRNLSGSTFDLGIDTSNTGIYPPYVGSGILTPLGGASGYFDFGVMTMNGGVASGFAMEVRSYVPGQWILQLPIAGGLLTPSAGDAYTMVAGCDKSLTTCHDKFSNVINMRAEPYLPGIDKIIQIGKHA